jgi:hypothetical protein
VRDFVVFCEDDDGKRLMGEEKSRFSGIGAPHFDALCARPHPLETLLHQGDSTSLSTKLVPRKQASGQEPF